MNQSEIDELIADSILDSISPLIPKIIELKNNLEDEKESEEIINILY